MKTIIFEQGKNIQFSSENVQRLLKEAKQYAKNFENISNEQLFKEGRFDDIVNKNLLWAIKIAAKYSGNKFHISDLISPALMGLWKAIKSYEPNRKVKFITFATKFIWQEISNFIKFGGADSYSERRKEEFFSDDIIDLPEQKVEFSCPEELKEIIKILLKFLTEREKFIIEKIYFENFRRESIAELLNVSFVTIYNLEKKALKKMKKIYPFLT